MSFRPDQYMTNGTDPLWKSEWNKLDMKAPRGDSGKHESAEFIPTQSRGERPNPQTPVSAGTHLCWDECTETSQAIMVWQLKQNTNIVFLVQSSPNLLHPLDDDTTFPEHLPTRRRWTSHVNLYTQMCVIVMLLGGINILAFRSMQQCLNRSGWVWLWKMHLVSVCWQSQVSKTKKQWPD